MTFEELNNEPTKAPKVESHVISVTSKWHCPRCRLWVIEEVRKVCEHCRKVERELETKDMKDDFDDEVLPENVFKAYIAGEICYMTCTEDGRVVRLDEWTLPGVVG